MGKNVMRSLRFSEFGPPSILRIQEVAIPEPGVGEALVHVKAAAINPSDIGDVAGHLKTTTLPRTPGRDFAGVVAKGRHPEGAEVWGSSPRLYIAITNGAFQDWTMQPSGIIATGGMWSALDPATGKILCQTAEPTGSWAFGPVSVANGVLHAGSMDPKGFMRALDAATGRILWSFASGGSVASGPAIAGGMVFWGSGYQHLNSSTVHQSVGNDMFYAFEPVVLPNTSRLNGGK
jgi:hypothetical protein